MNCTVWIARPDLLPKLFLQKPPTAIDIDKALGLARLMIVQLLRKTPHRVERPLTSIHYTA